VSAGDTCGGVIGSTSGSYTFYPAGPTPPASCVVAIEDCDGAVPTTCDVETAMVDITPVNGSPTITSNAPDTAEEDMLYSYAASAVDGDGPVLSWFVLEDDTCGGFVGESTGVYTFTPIGPALPESCVLAIEVCDGGVPELCDSEIADITLVESAIEVPVASPFGWMLLAALLIAVGRWQLSGRDLKAAQ
jgi:hypothetical protein